jgi:hypothetical protein
MADKHIHDLDAITAVTPDDLLVLENDPGGTPATKKVTVADFLSLTAGIAALSDHGYHGITLTGRNYGESVTLGQLVYLSDADGEWKIADADAAGKWPARGIAVNSNGNGQAAIVLVFGVMRDDSWSWTEGSSLYMHTTAGAMSHTAPSSSGSCVQIVGFALEAHEVFFNFTGVYAEIT